MIVNTRRTTTRPAKTLTKRAAKQPDGKYRMQFYAQFAVDLDDMAHALALHCTAAEFAMMVTRGQMLDAVQTALIQHGIAEISFKRVNLMASPHNREYHRQYNLVRAKLVQLFPDFFPKFARPRT